MKAFIIPLLKIKLAELILFTIFYIWLCLSKGGIVNISDYYNFTNIKIFEVLLNIPIFVICYVIAKEDFIKKNA